MSKTEETIEISFPGVPWTGGSGIHRSLAKGGVVYLPPDKHSLIMATLSKYKFGYQVWEFLQKYFSDAEFLVSADEFVNFAMVEYSRHLRGLGDLASDQKLTNPITGNKFHRIVLAGTLVGGIRFWAGPYGEGTLLGFRFRVENQDEEEEQTRVRMAETLNAIEKEMVDIEEWVFEAEDPPVCETLEAIINEFELEGTP